MAALTIRASSQAWATDGTKSWNARVLWDTGSALYAVLQDAGASPRVRVLKADSRLSPTSFTEVDSANNKAGVQNLSYDSYFDGTYIHIWYHSATSTVTHFKFDPSTDLWTTGGGTASTNLVGYHTIRGVVRTSDGAIAVAGSEALDDCDMTIAVYNGSTWTATQYKGATSTLSSNVVELATSGTFFQIFYYDIPNGDLSYKSMNGATLGSEVDLDTSAGTTAANGPSGGRWNPATVSGTPYVWALSRNVGSTISVARRVTLNAVSNAANIDATNGSVAGGAVVSVLNGGNSTWYDSVADTLWVYGISSNTSAAGTVQCCKRVAGTWDSTLTNLVTGMAIEVAPIGVGAAYVYQDASNNVKMDVLVAYSVPPLVISGVLATGSGATQNPTPISSVPYVLANGSAAGSTPNLVSIAKPLRMSASALAQPPNVLIPVIAIVPLMTASGLASAPTLRSTTLDTLANASSQTFNPTLRASILDTLATASAAGITPTLLLSILDTLANASAQTFNPSIPQPPVMVSGVVANSSLLSYLPSLRLGVRPPFPANAGPRMMSSNHWSDPNFTDLSNTDIYFVDPADTLTSGSGVARWTTTGTGEFPYTWMNTPGEIVASNIRWTFDIRASRNSATAELSSQMWSVDDAYNAAFTPLSLTTSFQTISVDLDGSRGNHPAIAAYFTDATPGDWIEIRNPRCFVTTEASPSVQITAKPPISSASALFMTPSFLIGPNVFVVPLMTGSGAMQPPTLRAIVAIPLATGSAATGTPKLLAIISPPLASASASLPVPSFLIGPNTFAVPLMGASGLVPLPLIRTTVNNPLAAISGSTSNPTVLLKVLDTLASVSGQTFNPNFLIGPNTFVVPIMTASGLELVPLIRLTVNDPVAEATGVTFNPSLIARVLSGLMGASTQSIDPTFLIGPNLLAVPIMTASAQSLNPAFLIGPNTIVIPLSTGSSDAIAPLVRLTAQSPLASGSAATATPTVILRVIDTLATATGQTYNPAFLIGPNTVAVPLMSASGSALATTLKAVVQIPLDLATAATVDPVIRATIQSALASASVLSLDPNVVIQDQPILIDVSLASGSGIFRLPALVLRVLGTLSTAAVASITGQLRTTVQSPVSAASATPFNPAFLIGPNLLAVPVMPGSAGTFVARLRSDVRVTRMDSSTLTNTPTATIRVPDTTALSDALFFDPSTQEGATVIAATISNGSSNGFAPIPAIVSRVPIAGSDSASFDPTQLARILPTPASSSAAGVSPSVTTQVPAQLIPATGSATAPKLRLTIPVDVLQAAGFFPEPVVDVQVAFPVTIDVPLGSISANFLTPSLSGLLITITLSTASIDGKDPVPVIEVHAPTMGVSSDGKNPTLHSIVLIPQALGSATGINPSTVTVLPIPMAQAAGMIFDPNLSLTVLSERMEALGTFLEPFLSAEHPWAMQFVALARTLLVEATERNLDVDAGLRALDGIANDRELITVVPGRTMAFIAQEDE
jgi:hypothetical protein